MQGDRKEKGVALKVNGREYAGWKAATVTRGIEAASGSFELEVSERWAEEALRWPVKTGDECSVSIDDVPLITGYVDRRAISLTDQEHTVSLAGRDRAGALVDCSAVLGAWEFKKISLGDFASRVADAFGMKVRLAPGLQLPNAPAKISVAPGETAFEALDKVCRLAGVLPISDGAGGLVLTRAGSARAATGLVEGENILSASAEYDSSARFHRYLVLGQHQGSDDLSGASAALITAEAFDMGVRRTERVLLIRPEGNVTIEHAKKRAQWEATVRAARGATVTVLVQGWRQGDGSLWPVNARVPIKSPSLELDTEMLITQATYSVGASGSFTRLNLRRPDAFLPAPVIEEAPKASPKPWDEIARGV